MTSSTGWSTEEDIAFAPQKSTELNSANDLLIVQLSLHVLYLDHTHHFLGVSNAVDFPILKMPDKLGQFFFAQWHLSKGFCIVGAKSACHRALLSVAMGLWHERPSRGASDTRSVAFSLLFVLRSLF